MNEQEKKVSMYFKLMIMIIVVGGSIFFILECFLFPVVDNNNYTEIEEPKRQSRDFYSDKYNCMTCEELEIFELSNIIHDEMTCMFDYYYVSHSNSGCLEDITYRGNLIDEKCPEMYPRLFPHLNETSSTEDDNSSQI